MSSSPLFCSSTSSSTAPLSVSQFGSSAALSASIPSNSTSGSLFGSTGAFASTFSFTSASTSTSPSPFSAPQPVFGSSKSVFSSGSAALQPNTPVFGQPQSMSNSQMSMEDSMAEDTIQASAPLTPVFGQQQSMPNSGFFFGSPSPSVTPSLFQFGSQPSPTPPANKSPFQAPGGFNAGGSFSLGTGGGDKAGRKIVKLLRFNRAGEGLGVFKRMRGQGIGANEFCFSAVLHACKEVGDGCFGRKQNGLLDKAVEVFKAIVEDALVVPNQVSVLSACANAGALDFGKLVHGFVLKLGLIVLPYVRNSLMDMYFKCVAFEDAVKMFENTQEIDVVTWNVMAMGCVQSKNYYEEACSYFWTMRREGILPDEASLSTVLHASANIAALNQGALVHSQLIKLGFEGNICVSSSLITMYSKCGSLVAARNLFSRIKGPNVVCWTGQPLLVPTSSMALQVKLFIPLRNC
ncbi:hypothetical protein QQ045_004467 [Rhodiola kirilowii]